MSGIKVVNSTEMPQEVCCYESDELISLGEGEGRPSMYQVCYKMIPLCVELRQNLPCMVVFNF